jgi:hypothetical protein
MWEVISEEETIKLHLHVKVHRRRIQPLPRHLLHLCRRGPRTGTGIVLHRQKPLNVKIGNTDLVPDKRVRTIRGRVILSCLTRMMSSGDKLDREDMVEMDDGKKLLEAS